MEFQPLYLVCREDNDLYRVLLRNDWPCRRWETVAELLPVAGLGAGVLVLADGYPDALTSLDEALFATAMERQYRLYVEFPSSLPGATLSEPREITWERGVVCTDILAPLAPRRQILMIHGCRYVPVALTSTDAMIALARVAGFETAVYGLPPGSAPLLFEQIPGRLLVATTKLSQFITARYAPPDAWHAIWEYVLAWVRGPESASQPAALSWTSPIVCPMYGPEGPLPPDVEDQALRAGIDWYRRAKLLIHPSWEGEARRRLLEWPDGTGPGPDAAWPAGDGSRGMIEGASSTIHPDGSQNWRYHVRNDCMGESSMAMACAGALWGDDEAAAASSNLNDYVHFHSPHSGGPRADPASASYGLLCWTSNDARGGVYYGDDNARSMLGTIAAAALLGEDRWDQSLLRCLLANLRTTGPLGFRRRRIEEENLQALGWQHYWTDPLVDYAPHYESWLWACFLWAYRATGYAPFLERAKTALGMTVAAYPDAWQWTNGMQQERARMLLPLAWLVRLEDTPEHRGWLRKMAEELLALQDACGAIREEVGGAGRGSYGPPRSNEEYGTNEATLIQENGDPLCDLLYTTNFAFIGLHEAQAATGDSWYGRAEDKLADFLCRIQVRAESRPELHGAWFRALDYKRWDYWASNADLGWGAWSIESGWTQGWITATLAMRRMGISFWGLTAQNEMARHLPALLPVMLPPGR